MFIKNVFEGWNLKSVVEGLFNSCKALSSMTSTAKLINKYGNTLEVWLFKL